MTQSQLSNRQQKAIATLLTERNVPAAAKAAGVGKRTLYRWLTQPEFKAAVQQSVTDAIGAAVRRLVGLSGKAIDTIEEILDDKDIQLNHPYISLRAAISLKGDILKISELWSLEERISELERTVKK